jgi:hypothetical protein
MRLDATRPGKAYVQNPADRKRGQESQKDATLELWKHTFVNVRGVSFLSRLCALLLLSCGSGFLSGFLLLNWSLCWSLGGWLLLGGGLWWHVDGWWVLGIGYQKLDDMVEG